jgi:hypothetical protein
MIVALGLSTIGCDDTSSSSSSESTTDSTQKVASYTTVWHQSDEDYYYSSYYYETRYSVTSVPFEGITYSEASSEFNGPTSSTADINYVGTANVGDSAYLTHWPDGSSTYSTQPFEDVDYYSRTVYNNDDSDYYYSSYYMSYVLHEGSAYEGSRDDYVLSDSGDEYVDKTPEDNDGKESSTSDNE